MELLHHHRHLPLLEAGGGKAANESRRLPRRAGSELEAGGAAEGIDFLCAAALPLPTAAAFNLIVIPAFANFESFEEFLRLTGIG